MSTRRSMGGMNEYSKKNIRGFIMVFEFKRKHFNYMSNIVTWYKVYNAWLIICLPLSHFRCQPFSSSGNACVMVIICNNMMKPYNGFMV